MASAWPAAIVTLVEAERELVMKSPAFARSVSVPSGTPESSKPPPADVRTEAKKSGACALTLTPASCASGKPVTTPRTTAPSASMSWTSWTSSPVTHRFGGTARLVAERGARACSGRA